MDVFGFIRSGSPIKNPAVCRAGFFVCVAELAALTLQELPDFADQPT